MSWTSFGDLQDGIPYRVLDERTVRGSAGIMLVVGSIAFVNGFVLKRYVILPYIAGFLLLNFLVGLFVNPNYSPTMLVSKLLVRKQAPIPIGAIQKRFAWSLGLLLSGLIFSLSLPLQSNVAWFEPVCMLCIICLVLLLLETAFGICVGCKLYQFAVRLGWLKKPDVAPNCMGDACSVDT